MLYFVKYTLLCKIFVYNFNLQNTIGVAIMANMTYCAMQNTYNDLNQAYEILEEKGISGLSDSEKAYASRLAKLCEQFVEAHAECVVLEADLEIYTGIL